MRILFFVFLSAMTTIASGQGAFTKKGAAITVGYGVPNIYKRLVKQDMQNTDAYMKSLAKNYGSSFTYSTSGVGPLFFKYDYGVSDKVGIGFVVGFFNPAVTEKYTYTRTTAFNKQQEYYQAITRSNTSLSIGARFNYHFGEKNKVDPYVGFAFGYTHATLVESFTTDDPDVADKSPYVTTQALPIYAGVTIGIRDYITDRFGVYIELGLDKWSLVQGGIALRFP